jgi:hypothetical protein
MDTTNPGHDNPWTRQTLDTTNSGQNKHWTEQTLDTTIPNQFQHCLAPNITYCAQDLLCPGFVVSRVCRVKGLSCPGFDVSRVCLARVCLCNKPKDKRQVLRCIIFTSGSHVTRLRNTTGTRRQKSYFWLQDYIR